MNKITKIIIVLTAMALIAAGTAAYYIYSNIVTVTVTEYILELEVDQAQVSRYTNVTFTAYLSIDYMIPIVDVPIDLLKNDVVISTETTDNFGRAYFTVNMTDSLGVYDFKAAYQTP